MINRSPLCMIFTSDLHYCIARLKCPTRLRSASTFFIKICLHIKFTLIYESAFRAVHLNATLPSLLLCSPAGWRAEIFQDENKLKMAAEGLVLSKNANNRLFICSAFCHHHITAYYHFCYWKTVCTLWFSLITGISTSPCTHTHTKTYNFVALINKKCLGWFIYLFSICCVRLFGFRIWSFRCFHFLSYVHTWNSDGLIYKLSPTLLFQEVNFSSFITWMLIVKHHNKTTRFLKAWKILSWP